MFDIPLRGSSSLFPLVGLFPHVDHLLIDYRSWRRYGSEILLSELLIMMWKADRGVGYDETTMTRRRCDCAAISRLPRNLSSLTP